MQNVKLGINAKSKKQSNNNLAYSPQICWFSPVLKTINCQFVEVRIKNY